MFRFTETKYSSLGHTIDYVKAALAVPCSIITIGPSLNFGFIQGTCVLSLSRQRGGTQNAKGIYIMWYLQHACHIILYIIPKGSMRQTIIRYPMFVMSATQYSKRLCCNDLFLCRRPVETPFLMGDGDDSGVVLSGEGRFQWAGRFRLFLGVPDLEGHFQSRPFQKHRFEVVSGGQFLIPFRCQAGYSNTMANLGLQLERLSISRPN
jgi:hypothetical protein